MRNFPLLKSLVTSTMEIKCLSQFSPSQNVDEDEEMEDFVNAQPPQCPPLYLKMFNWTPCPISLASLCWTWYLGSYVHCLMQLNYT